MIFGLRRIMRLRSAVVLSLLGIVTLAPAVEPVVSDAQGNAWKLDTEGMHRKGYVVYVWQVQNLAQPDEQGARSIRSQVEFDCRFRKSRTMWITQHTERDEGGKVISSGAVMRPEWAPADPGSVTDTLLENACRRIMR
jgi:hypothetical protein